MRLTPHGINVIKEYVKREKQRLGTTDFEQETELVLLESVLTHVNMLEDSLKSISRELETLQKELEEGNEWSDLD